MNRKHLGALLVVVPLALMSCGDKPSGAPGASSVGSGDSDEIDASEEFQPLEFGGMELALPNGDLRDTSEEVSWAYTFENFAQMIATGESTIRGTIVDHELSFDFGEEGLGHAFVVDVEKVGYGLAPEPQIAVALGHFWDASTGEPRPMKAMPWLLAPGQEVVMVLKRSSLPAEMQISEREVWTPVGPEAVILIGDESIEVFSGRDFRVGRELDGDSVEDLARQLELAVAQIEAGGVQPAD